MLILKSAELLVSVGRGIEKEENIQLAFELANALGAEVSASRPVVDSGWIDSFRQVGSSGSNVAPKLYFSLGISGAIQHVVGMKGAKSILAINKDKDAPIFEIADYAVIGDVLEIVPKLTEALKINKLTDLSLKFSKFYNNIIYSGVLDFKKPYVNVIIFTKTLLLQIWI
ncbi:MAG: hypothetical protein CM15mP127_14370 [Gammaproteobacteria bacterium]|nr:MAG: hypothetical protein CM15mP127_14370 [Gammaproteobacteria bacterium]